MHFVRDFTIVTEFDTATSIKKHIRDFILETKKEPYSLRLFYKIKKATIKLQHVMVITLKALIFSNFKLKK